MRSPRFIMRRLFHVTRLSLSVLLVLSIGLGGACSEADAPRDKAAPSQPTADPNVFQPFAFVHVGDPQMGFGKDGIDGDDYVRAAKFDYNRDLVMSNGIFVAAPD